MVLMPSIRPEEPAAPMLPPVGGSGSGADSDESRLAEIEAKLAVSLKPPTPEPEIEPSPEELARIREQELAKLLAEEEAAAEEKARLEQERVDRERIQAREAKAEVEAESRRQAEAKAHADREKEAARRAKAEASAQAHQLHEQRDAQLTETYAATKIQAGARGAMARRSAAERMAKIELSKDEKLVKMVDNVFRVIRQHMKSDRKLYGKTLADAAEAFRVMDKDNSGALDAAEFGGALKRMGFGLTAEQVEAVVQSVDTSGDGEIDYTEYISLLAKGDPELAETEEAQVLETRRQEARERRKAKRKAAAKKSAQMRKSSALGQTIMTADERVALLEAKAAQDAAASAVPDEEAAIKIQAAIRGRQTRVQKRKGKEAPEAPSKEAPKVSPEATKEAPKVTPLEVEDQPVQFGEGNWMPHQHSFDADTSGFGFDQEPAPAVKKPFVPPRNFAGHRSWRDWYAANEEQVSSILVPGRKIVNNDTAEIKLLKDKFKSLVYGRKHDPATLLFKKFDPNGDGELDLQEFTEAVRRNWKGRTAPLTKKQISNIFKACDADGSGEIDMAELAEFVWGKTSAEADQARNLMRTGGWLVSPHREQETPLQETPRAGVEYLELASVGPDADGPPPTLQETMVLRSKLKQASYGKGGQNPAELFRKFDADGSGELDMAEFILAVRKGGKMNKDQMSDRDIRRLFRLIDADGGGEISIAELTTYVWGDQGFSKTEREESSDVPPESFATVRQAFFGTTQEQLNVARGDIVTINDRKGVWCKVRDHSTGRTGLVPTAYINMPPGPGEKRPTQLSVVSRLTQQTKKETDTNVLAHSAGQTGKKEYWRTIAVPLEAHIAAARKGLFVPEVLQGAREFFHTHADMQEKLAKPAPARNRKLSQLATPKGGASALQEMRAQAEARQKEFAASGMGEGGTPRVPQPPSGKKPLGTASLTFRAKPSPRRLRSLNAKGSESERRQGPREFGVDSYVGQSAVKSLRTQIVERRVREPAEATAEVRSAEQLARRLNERDIETAKVAVERKAKLEEEHFASKFDTQLAAAKREIHSQRLKSEQENQRRAAHDAKVATQEEAAARRRAKVQLREEQTAAERVEYNRVKAANAQAKADEELVKKLEKREEKERAREELNAHIAKEQARRAAKHRGVFGAAPEGWRSLKKNERAFRKIKGDAERQVEQDLQLARTEGPIRQRKLAALHQEFTVTPTENGTYPRHTMPELVYALEKVGKGDLRLAVVYLTEEGAPTWAATTLQSRFRGNRDRTEMKRRHAAAKAIQTRVRGMQARVHGRQYMEETRAARRIQARRRGIQQRQRLLEQQTAAIRIQSAERGRAARAKRMRMIHANKATILQQLCRRRLARTALAQQTAAALLVQRNVRGWRTRMIMAALRAETDWYTMVKKGTAQVDAEEKSKKIPSSEGSVLRPGERVINTLASQVMQPSGILRIKFTTSGGSEGWLSVSDKKGKPLMTPIHRWLVRGKPMAAAHAGKGSDFRHAKEGKLRWKHADDPLAVDAAAPGAA